ncbi:MAG: NADH-quinone oxidoreductase subunit L [Sphingobacteriaceae bacterium]|nr:MAG: NADH-quinone oxidoreductase subunit L [Sphingobacteriaceae bacterium]
MLELAWLIPLLPLIGFLINGLGRKVFSKGMVSLIGCGVILASFILSVLVFMQTKNGVVLNANYYDFINISSFKLGFEFKIDQLSSLFLLIITGVGFLIHVYSTSYMHEEDDKDFAKYFAYLNLFVFSMLLLVLGGNFVIMFIGWEGVGLCSYLLIGYWFKKKEYTSAANKAFIMNRIGDLGFLLAVFWFIAKVGSVNFDIVFSAESLAKLSPTDITGITLLLFLGATGKSAQIPLYTWLPDAMAGPTPVSALIHAATMVTAGIYMIARSNALFSMAGFTMTIITFVGLATALLAASIAIKQNDIKKVLAYSTVSQLGFMFIALGTGNYIAAVFHVLTHAFFKALMFLGSGSVIHAMGGEQDIRKMGGLHSKMKITSITFLIGCLAISGIPGLSGFFSKDEILAGAYAAHGYGQILYSVTLFAALLTAFYMFRLYFITFTGKFRGTHEQEHHLHESPAAMTIPLVVLAVLSVIGGFVGVPEALGGHHELAAFLAPVVKTAQHHLDHNTEYMLMGLSTLLVIVSIFLAWSKFKNYKVEGEATGLGKILENKWYVDELYQSVIVNPLRSLSLFLNNIIERKGIDGIVNGVGKAVHYSSRQLRLLQSGQVGLYVLLMVIGMLALFIIQLFV